MVSKYALQNEIPADIILNRTDINCLETRALARLGGHGFILSAVDDFRKKYPNWKSNITELMVKLGVKPKIKKTKKVKLEETVYINVKENIEKVVNLQDFLRVESERDPAFRYVRRTKHINREKKYFHECHDNQSKPVISTKAKNENVRKCDENQSTSIISEEKNENVNESDKNINTNQDNYCFSEIPDLVEINVPVQNSNSIENESVIKPEEKLLKRKAEQNALDNNGIGYKMKKNMADDIKPACETVDSFFMTADDKEYMSVYKPLPTVKKNLENPQVEHKKLNEDIFIKGKKVKFTKQKNVGNRKIRRQQQFEEPVDNKSCKLHPSWEAKRKQKSLAKFEGKKITFDDQD